MKVVRCTLGVVLAVLISFNPLLAQAPEQGHTIPRRIPSSWEMLNATTEAVDVSSAAVTWAVPPENEPAIRRSSASLIGAGMVGALIGVAVGGRLGLEMDRNGDLPDFAGAFTGMVIGSSIMVPTSVHLFNGLQGDFSRSFSRLLNRGRGRRGPGTRHRHYPHGGPHPLGPDRHLDGDRATDQSHGRLIRASRARRGRPDNPTEASFGHTVPIPEPDGRERERVHSEVR